MVTHSYGDTDYDVTLNLCKDKYCSAKIIPDQRYKPISLEVPAPTSAESCFEWAYTTCDIHPKSVFVIGIPPTGNLFIVFH